MDEWEADVVVIGGGAIGASTAYHLARAGRKVTLVERRSMATGCSSATYAAINISAKEGDSYIAFTLAASELFTEIERELDADLEYGHDGSIALVVEKESEWPAVLRNVEELNRVPGVNTQVLRGAEVHRLEPALPPWVHGIAFCPVDGHINPFSLVATYLRRARRLGAVVSADTEVQGIEVRAGAVEAVVTSRGKIHAPWVISAAGIDSPAIGRMVGVTIPVVPAHGQVMTTVPVRPFLRYDMRGVRQLPSRNVNVGSTRSYVGLTRAPRVDLLPEPSRKATRLFPFLKDVPVQRIWTGVRPWPIDGLPILGPVQKVQGFLVAVTHSGITLSEMIGHVLTDLVVEGHTSVNINQYRPDRFSGEQLSYVAKLFRESQAAQVPATG